VTYLRGKIQRFFKRDLVVMGDLPKREKYKDFSEGI
jgi:hypothetical protein